MLRYQPTFRGPEYIDRINDLIAKSSLFYLNDANIEGYSALMYAAERNLQQFSYSLLLRGVDVTQRSTTGETALSLAMYNSDQKDHVIRNMIMYYFQKGSLGSMLYMSSDFYSSYNSFTDALFENFIANETHRSIFT